MLIEGSKLLAADRATVWEKLNDTAFLRATLPDCKSLTETPEGYQAVLSSAIGPVRASFNVAFRREIDVPLQSYTLSGAGDGGMAGSAEGRIRIELSDVDGGTLLAYSAETTINGKIAQLGSRLIDSAARKFSERFFLSVQQRLAPAPMGELAAADAPAAMPAGLPAAAPAQRPAPAGAINWWLPVACAVGSFAGTWLGHYLG